MSTCFSLSKVFFFVYLNAIFFSVRKTKMTCKKFTFKMCLTLAITDLPEGGICLCFL